MGLFLFTSALSSAIAEACTPALNDPYLIWPFVGTAVAGLVLAAIFYIMYRKLDNDTFIVNPDDNIHDRQLESSNSDDQESRRVP